MSGLGAPTKLPTADESAAWVEIKCCSGDQAWYFYLTSVIVEAAARLPLEQHDCSKHRCSTAKRLQLVNIVQCLANEAFVGPATVRTMQEFALPDDKLGAVKVACMWCMQDMSAGHEITLVRTKRSHVSDTTRTDAVLLMSRNNDSSPK